MEDCMMDLSHSNYHCTTTNHARAQLFVLFTLHFGVAKKIVENAYSATLERLTYFL